MNSPASTRQQKIFWTYDRFYGMLKIIEFHKNYTEKRNGFYVRLLGEMKMSEPLPAKPQGKGKVSERDTDAEVKDSQLIFENGRYFLCVPYVDKKKPREPSDRIVALDPGVRDFMTFFAEDRFGWLGQQCINRIQRLCQHCDNLYARAT